MQKTVATCLMIIDETLHQKTIDSGDKNKVEIRCRLARQRPQDTPKGEDFQVSPDFPTETGIGGKNFDKSATEGECHRDLKPTNLMLVPDQLVAGGERVKILDFGIAKLAADTNERTATGLVMGTPTYMSPEQCRGAGAVDAKTDVYALGIILFEMLVGYPPFVAVSAGELMGMHLFQPPGSVAKLVPGLSPELAEYVLLLLKKDRSQRPSMREVFQKFIPSGVTGKWVAASAEPTPPPSRSALTQLFIDDRRPAGPSGRAASGAPLPLPVRPRPAGDQRRISPAVVLLNGGILVAIGLTFLFFATHGQVPRPPVVPTAVVDVTPDAGTAVETPGADPLRVSDTSSRSAAVPAISKRPRRHSRVDPKPSPSPVVAAPVKPPPEPSPPVIPDPDASDRTWPDTLINKAQAAYTSTRYLDAMAIARSIQKARPGPAFLILGLSACRIKDVKQADEAFQNLDAGRRKFVIDECLNQRISHQRGVFILESAARGEVIPPVVGALP